jgi:hypothetical protein
MCSDALCARTIELPRWPLASLASAANGTRFVRRALISAWGLHARNVMRDEEGRKVETAVEARAGFLDRPVLVVLCVSLALGVVILGALWFGYFTPNA